VVGFAPTWNGDRFFREAVWFNNSFTVFSQMS